MTARLDQVRSQFRKAGKEGLPQALGLLKTRTNTAAPPRDLEQGPDSGTHPRHAVTDPISTGSAFSGPTGDLNRRNTSQSGLQGNSISTHSTNVETSPISPDDTKSDGLPQVAEEAPDEHSPEETDNDSEKLTPRQKLFAPSKVPLSVQIRRTLFPHIYTINWLLLAVPIGIGLHFTKVNPLAIFIVNFLAIVPLAGILSYATEEIALRVGEVIGGLLNASFGNAVELIVGIIALVKGEIIIVQTSLVGSMLSNLLLVMGMCFFFGGWRRTHQNFNTTVAQTAASLLALAVGSLIIPTAYTWGNNFNPATSDLDEQLSRGTAIIMLIVYASYLFFQLKSHKDVFNEASEKVQKKAKKKHHSIKQAVARVGHHSAAHAGQGRNIQPADQPAVLPEDNEPEEPTLSFVGALVTLCISTAFVGVCAEFLVDSISQVTCQYNVSDYFVGLILLPIVGNAAEHATAVTVAIKDKMDLAIGVAVGSSMQIALLVLPLMVVLGWIIHRDMTLLFDSFQIAVLFVAIILVNYLIADGKSRKFLFSYSKR
jgi:Ca2+:H+ antiporter